MASKPLTLLVVVLVLVLAACAAGQGSAGPTIAEETTSHNAEETTVLQGGGDLRRPPESTLFYGGREVTGSLGSYCWSYGSSGVCADTAGQPPPKRKTLTVPSGSEMVFRYGGQRSPDMVKARAYPFNKKSGENGSLKVHGSGVERTIPATLPPGEYVVEVYVKELQGDAPYRFRVMVE
jgi:hypothetical protein